MRDGSYDKERGLSNGLTFVVKTWVYSVCDNSTITTTGLSTTEARVDSRGCAVGSEVICVEPRS